MIEQKRLGGNVRGGKTALPFAGRANFRRLAIIS
jgi:hypothetical protein